MGRAPASGLRQPVWDRFVRFFHGSLVTCVLLNYSVLEQDEWQHQWVGHLACALVAVRVVWGFIGSRHARFADFVPTPARVKHHIGALLAKRPTPMRGTKNLLRCLGRALMLSAGRHTAMLVVGRLERTRLIKPMVTGVKDALLST
jgi:cytochrome b